MLDVSVVHETSPEANWNRQAGRRTNWQTCVLGGCTSKKCENLLSLEQTKSQFLKLEINKANTKIQLLDSEINDLQRRNSIKKSKTATDNSTQVVDAIFG